MSRLTDLIAKAKAKDPQLGADMEREFRALSSRLSFGLNFERHRPEAVELAQRRVRRGDKVRVLPARGSTTKGDPRLWLVKKIVKAGKKKRAELKSLDPSAEQSTAQLDDLIVIAEFRDIIYPGLASTGKVSRGGDKPCHTVINGENYHVLKALTWTHRGKVDAIYIDPPYNTGAKDWKYSNDYVEKDDLYRHSKWLAMMERRLMIAKELLNPADSVLIVTIDEKEHLRLGMLLEQSFPEARMRMISTEISRKGSARSDDFARVDEYIFVLLFGNASVGQLFIDGISVAPAGGRKEKVKVAWESMLRRGTGSMRTDSHLKFYPVLVDQNSQKVVGRGEILPLGQHPSDYTPPPDLIAVWPMRSNGAEGRWQLNTASFSKRFSEGHIKAGRFKKDGSCAVLYYSDTE